MWIAVSNESTGMTHMHFQPYSLMYIASINTIISITFITVYLAGLNDATVDCTGFRGTTDEIS